MQLNKSGSHILSNYTYSQVHNMQVYFVLIMAVLSPQSTYVLYVGFFCSARPCSFSVNANRETEGRT